ncbi:hypothetical protein Patl1_35989 [Pistacia atlantica]|nr:hypothetical protein Patl1_35989 [Pistacia atlantica]
MPEEECLSDSSETNSWYQYYARAAYDYQLRNHNLVKERNELSAKLHSANSSANFMKLV